MRLRSYLLDETGAVAAEFGMLMVLLLPAMFAFFDVGSYVFQKMQVENAAEMAAQAAFATCSSAPASGCDPKLSVAVAAAIKSTSLGTAITEKSASRINAYYCPDTATNTLIATGSSSATTCSSGSTSGYYVAITVQKTFTPFLGLASFFPTTIEKQAWVRIA